MRERRIGRERGPEAPDETIRVLRARMDEQDRTVRNLQSNLQARASVQPQPPKVPIHKRLTFKAAAMAAAGMLGPPFNVAYGVALNWMEASSMTMRQVAFWAAEDTRGLVVNSVIAVCALLYMAVEYPREAAGWGAMVLGFLAGCLVIANWDKIF